MCWLLVVKQAKEVIKKSDRIVKFSDGVQKWNIVGHL